MTLILGGTFTALIKLCIYQTALYSSIILDFQTFLYQNKLICPKKGGGGRNPRNQTKPIKLEFSWIGVMGRRMN